MHYESFGVNIMHAFHSRCLHRRSERMVQEKMLTWETFPCHARVPFREVDGCRIVFSKLETYEN